jgi:hypothetical protein
VSLQVVVAAALADEAARRLRLTPAVAVPSIPDTVLRTQRPFPAFAVDDTELADGRAERTRVKSAAPSVTEQLPVPHLCLAEGIDSHRASI